MNKPNCKSSGFKVSRAFWHSLIISFTYYFIHLLFTYYFLFASYPLFIWYP